MESQSGSGLNTSYTLFSSLNLDRKSMKQAYSTNLYPYEPRSWNFSELNHVLRVIQLTDGRSDFSPRFCDSNLFTVCCLHDTMLAAVVTTRGCLKHGAETKPTFSIPTIAHLRKLLAHAVDPKLHFLLSNHMCLSASEPRVPGRSSS